MSGLAKAFVVINLILALFFLGASATLFQTNKNWKEAAEQSTVDIKEWSKEWSGAKETLEGKLAQLDGNVRTLQNENSVLDTQKSELENQMGELRKDITRLESSVTTLTASLGQKDLHLQDKDNAIAQKDEAIDRLSREKTEAAEAEKLATQRAARASLDLDQLEQQLSTAQMELVQLQKTLTDKELLLASVEKIGIKLDDIGVQVAPKIDGVVVAVRDGMVVLSVGRDDMVKEGYEFTVYEGSRFVGKVKVENVLDDMAGARILFTEENASIQVGQNASTRLAG